MDEGERGPTVLHVDHEHERRKTAYHEAGHLAAAWALGGKLFSGDIIPTEELGGQAVYTLGSDGDASPARIISILAGPLAQRRVAPFEDDGGGQDHERVADKLGALCRHPKAAAIVLSHCRTEAARLLTEQWDAVEAIAAAFLERDHLTGDELATILAGVEWERRDQRRRDFNTRTSAARTTTENTAWVGPHRP